jgi:hypothetical protein
VRPKVSPKRRGLATSEDGWTVDCRLNYRKKRSKRANCRGRRLIYGLDRQSSTAIAPRRSNYLDSATTFNDHLVWGSFMCQSKALAAELGSPGMCNSQSAQLLSALWHSFCLFLHLTHSRVYKFESRSFLCVHDRDLLAKRQLDLLRCQMLRIYRRRDIPCRAS